MIHLFEVTVPLDAGYHMHILMAAPDKPTAIAEAAKQLRASASPIRDGDWLRFNWSQSMMSAKEVTL